MSRNHERELWAVILAAGEGKRLASLTSALYGRDLPKQFAAIQGERSLLQATLERIAPLVPSRRTVVVVGKHHEDLAREQLRAFPGTRLIGQPRNLNTGPGILLPLSKILAWSPEASVAIFPSDHYVAAPRPFLRAVRHAVTFGDGDPGRVTLLGVAPERPETEYGWILPGPPLASPPGPGLCSVRGFVEKPDPEQAGRILRTGGLWNTFVSVGRLSAFWRLAERHLPDHAPLFRRYSRSVGAPGEARILAALYDRMATANFSRAVLEKANDLAVVPVRGSGWSDWGSPNRVFHSLAGTSHLDRLRERLAGRDGLLSAAT